MNKETQKGSAVRNYVKYRKYKTLLYRLFNTVVLLLLTAGAGYLLRKAQGCDCIPLKWGAAAFYYLIVLVFAGWLFSILSFMLRKAVVGVVCFAILFVWGSASYFMWHVDEDESRGQETVQVESTAHGNSFVGFFQQQLEAPNRAISAFFPSRGGFEHIDGKHRFHYFVFHMLVIAFVAAVMFSHFGRGLVNRFKKRYVIRQGKLNVFWGVDDVGLLCFDEFAQRHKVFGIAFPAFSGDGEEGHVQVLLAERVELRTHKRAHGAHRFVSAGYKYHFHRRFSQYHWHAAAKPLRASN